MKIGIITAMPEEFRAVADSLGIATATQIGTFRAGRFSMDGHDFLLVESGMGLGNAARAAEMLIQDGHPDLLISTGFCGGIAPELLIGDVVVAQKIVITNESGFDEIPVLLSSIGQKFVASQVAIGKRVVGGTFVTTATITSKVRLAAMLSGSHPNPVVEMESAAIAIIAAEHNIPLLAIRAVSDTAAEELGFSLDEFCDPEMRSIRIYRVLLTALRKPRIIPQIVRLALNSRVAAASLSESMKKVFAGL